MSETLRYQMSMWPAQREQRLELGDDFALPRAVDHFAYFSRRAAALSAAATLESNGFQVVTGRRRLRTVVQATRDERLGDAEVERFLAEVIAVVESARGDYDGWGSPIEVVDASKS
jgi:hypothetical protein